MRRARGTGGLNMFPPLSYVTRYDLTFRALYYFISMKEFTVGFVVDVEMRCSGIIVCDTGE